MGFTLSSGQVIEVPLVIPPTILAGSITAGAAHTICLILFVVLIVLGVVSILFLSVCVSFYHCVDIYARTR